ncbi:guanylate kinase [Coxiella endosymbiont of Amblyomma americanum]|uniref:guanylate kinase n=1 Tax=Coxiella endosymbiont of Amblyomma americanum TaxID=325775 RepID=UPI00057D6F72|nr:guanylate kinase [Coxiella endosymbiont of Amblyomma americanum]AJC50462.1 guanylate kinase [Coxiella endosymbiont of Amblyomma americanum]AUJ58802.1 guanylate kinase [Coxiella-like endosymbiont of Amblyomma americanum]
MDKRQRSHLFVVSAPSGAGKTSLVRALVGELDEIKISISYTTRPLRFGDCSGVDYIFINENQFQQMIRQGALLEHARVHNHHYGTSKTWVLKQLRAKKDVLLEIDWQGARQIRKLFPFAVTIFILPPSMHALRERLMKRHESNNSTGVIQRLSTAHEEIAHYIEYDYLVINDNFKSAVQDLIYIISAVRLQKEVQRMKFTKLLAELLKN